MMRVTLPEIIVLIHMTIDYATNGKQTKITPSNSSNISQYMIDAACTKRKP